MRRPGKPNYMYYKQIGFSISAILVMTASSGCRTINGDDTRDYIIKRVENINIQLPPSVKAGSTRGRTYIYWHMAHDLIKICADGYRLRQDGVNIFTQHSEIINALRALPIDRVDPDAVRAVLSTTRSIENGRKITSKLAREGSLLGVSIARLGLEGLSGAKGILSDMKDEYAIEKQADDELYVVRATLEARYHNHYEPIALLEKNFGGCTVGK